MYISLKNIKEVIKENYINNFCINNIEAFPCPLKKKETLTLNDKIIYFLFYLENSIKYKLS